jgi:hypothetical protein
MALDFPSSPTNGQVYGDYTYDGTAGVWRATTLQPVVVTVSDVPPASPKSGDTWLYATEGTLFVYYEDVDSSQWIEVRQNVTETNGNFSGNVDIVGSLDVGGTVNFTNNFNIGGLPYLTGYRYVDSIRYTSG